MWTYWQGLDYCVDCLRIGVDINRRINRLIRTTRGPDRHRKEEASNHQDQLVQPVRGSAAPCQVPALRVKPPSIAGQGVVCLHVLFVCFYTGGQISWPQLLPRRLSCRSRERRMVASRILLLCLRRNDMAE